MGGGLLNVARMSLLSYSNVQHLVPGREGGEEGVQTGSHFLSQWLI